MTSIPPTTVVMPSANAPSAPAAPAAGSTAVLTQLPETVRAAVPGTVISGTVVGHNQGQTLLQTNAGIIGLRTAAQLAIGSQITLQLQAAGSQLQAVLLSAIAPKPGTVGPGAARAATASGAGPTPATTLAVSGGPVLTATVISPTTGGPLPNNVPTAPAPAPNPAQASPPEASLTTSRAARPAPSPAASPSAASPSAVGAPPASSALPTASLVAQSLQPNASSGGRPIASAAATYAATPGATPAATPAASATTPAASALASSARPGPSPPLGAVASPPSASAVMTASASPAAQPVAQSAAVTPPMQPAASGTPVQLRLLGPTSGTPLAANQITGTLVGYVPGGQAVVDTPLGRLALPLPPGAAQASAGTSLLFELLGVGARPGASSSAAALPALGREWPTLKATMAALAEVDLPLARQILEINLPRPGTPRFLGQVLQYLASPTAASARSLLGDTAASALERTGRGEVLARLDAELREMTRLNASSSDWRVFYVPVLDINELRQLRIFTRKRKSGKDKEREGGRFVVEMDFDELGPLQIDGLVQKPRIDVILRSHVELAPALQAGIAEVFGRACDASGLIGKIFFHATAAFPVSPLDEIAKAGQSLSI